MTKTSPLVAAASPWPPAQDHLDRCAREKPEQTGKKDPEKVLANPWSRQRITKSAYANRGSETKWKTLFTWRLGKPGGTR
jgi:hypothetical protein